MESDDSLDSQDAWYDTQTHFERHHRRGIRPKTMKSVINRVMARKGYGQQQTSSQIRDAWREVVPEGLGSLTRVAEVRRGILEVYVSNSMALQQMGFLQHELLKQLQNRLTGMKLRGIRFKLGSQGPGQ